MTKNQKKLIIKNRSEQPLKLFEAADSTPDAPKYLFQGVFTECSTPEHVVINRNQRSYPLKECAAHIAYLRDQIKESGFILGELDHPADGRFDTSLKQASHAILDIWIDFDRAVVEGKLQLLDTPNGKIAKTLVDAGYPLYVSSRAAGSVGSDKNHTVKIDQLFSYDIVCVPGFANARLQRIDESACANPELANYLNESVNTQKKEAEITKSKFGIDDKLVSICECVGTVPELSEKAKGYLNGNFDMSELSKPINEGDEEVKLPETEEKSEDETKSKDNQEEKMTDAEKEEKRKLIVSVEAVAAGEESSDSEKEEKRAEILDIEAVEDTEDSEDNKDKKDETTEKSEESEKTEECDSTKSDDPRDIKTKNKKENTNDDVKKKVLNDQEKAQDVKQECEEQKDKVAELLKKIKTVNDVKENIVRNYPFSISLSDENFAQFAALKPAQKNKVQKFILENGIYDIERINNTWKTPLIEQKRELKNWLRLASAEDKKLFAQAPVDVQDAIEESAKFVIIRTQADCDRFWEKTGLRQKNADKILRESFSERYSINNNNEDKTLNESMEAQKNAAQELGYSMDYFKMLEDYYEK